MPRNSNNNIEIRRILKENKIWQWEIAEEMEIPEAYLSKTFRHELDEEKKAEILSIVNRILLKRKMNN